MPSSPDAPLQAGVYDDAGRVADGSTGEPGTATPTATAVIKLDTSVILDLHFYFLNFDEHPCSRSFGGQLDATTASTQPFFQNDYSSALRSVFAQRAASRSARSRTRTCAIIPTSTASTSRTHRSLLALGAHEVGINVFFVRTLSPVGPAGVRADARARPGSPARAARAS